MNYTDTVSILSVSELTKSIKSSLELQYRFIHVQGEISSLRIPYSGHIYFTLKDSGSQIKAVLFKGQQKFLAGKVREGRSVICHGRLSVYEPRGEYQIIVDTMDFAGIGNLQIKFEKLKRMLSAEGLFRSDNKISIPAFPDHIVLITSPTGAAVRDFLKIASMRKFWGKISVIPVAVQGKNSSAEIAEAIKMACCSTDADILVVLRGGGSLEDLWSFNEEQTARAIHEATLPVVTGIGHDTDITIADLCADLHTHTPTAAAEAIIADSRTLSKTFCNYKQFIAEKMQRRLGMHEEKVVNLRRIIGNLDLFLMNNHLKLDYRTFSLSNCIREKIARLTAEFENTSHRLRNQAPHRKIAYQEEKAAHLRRQLSIEMHRIIERKEEKLARQAALLDSVSPLSILSRGYSIVSKEEEPAGLRSIITSSEQVETGSRINVHLHHGELQCEVLGKKRGSRLPK